MLGMVLCRVGGVRHQLGEWHHRLYRMDDQLGGLYHWLGLHHWLGGLHH